ncbi:MAG: hypothetical protein IJ491_03185 [Clostridia bacterium]|nr:hypothetical protein [Clostridia bacterium]
MKNFIKQNRGLAAFIIIALFFAVWGLIFGKGDELIYTVFGQYIFLSIVNLICSASMVKKGGVLGFLSPVIIAILSTLLPICVLGKTDVAFVAFAVIPAAIGFVFGFIAYAVSKAKGKSKKEAAEKVAA